VGLTGLEPPRRHSWGGGAHRRPAKRELTGVGLGVAKEKGASTVHFGVTVAPEVDRSGSST
jgi:hypothetical protein